MGLLALLLLQAARPYWEAKPPESWTGDQLQQMLSNSPWARAEGYLASAKPMREAEERMKVRAPAKKHDESSTLEPAESDYAEFMRTSGHRHIVLAIRVEDPNEFFDAKEVRIMENGCWIKAGKKKIKLVGHFPPTPHDPLLRLVFPRVEIQAKTLHFELYLPGVSQPYRELEFFLKEMNYQGKLEY